MTLGELIAALKAVPNQNGLVPWGFGQPDSYRGYYEQVAFEPLENVTIASMLAAAESALGATFQGYKGGDYLMDEYTECWIAEYGRRGGDQIGETLLKYMVLSVTRVDGR